MMLLLALHKIAAERGDGLRPELLRLLERSQAGRSRQRDHDYTKVEEEEQKESHQKGGMWLTNAE